jgi:stearoyl-CoA desaturase (delta-9 desaturase)
VHAAAFYGVIAGGIELRNVLIFLLSYYLLMLGVTVGYHRYFSHKSFRLGRVPQFLLAVWTQISAQKGILWWAAHHRKHHVASDTEADPHSPKVRSFIWSHMGWFLSDVHRGTDTNLVKDLLAVPELRLLDRYHAVPAFLFCGIAFWIGGFSLLVWMCLLPIVMVWHVSYLVNSYSHGHGTRRFQTSDHSGNVPWLAVLTCGEGWHNNHHAYPGRMSPRVAWYEIDLAGMFVHLLAALGIAYDIKGKKQPASAG